MKEVVANTFNIKPKFWNETLCESNKQVGIRSESLEGIWILISIDSKMQFFFFLEIY